MPNHIYCSLKAMGGIELYISELLSYRNLHCRILLFFKNRKFLSHRKPETNRIQVRLTQLYEVKTN